MTSGKQSKRRRRAAAPPPPVRRRGMPRRASPRILAAAAAVLVLVGAGVGLAAVFGGGSSSSDVPERGSLANALPAAPDVEELLQGIPQRGRVLGQVSAPVTLVEYIDLQCPFCREFVAGAMPEIVEEYVRPGKVKVESRIIAFLGPDSERGRKAALAAGEQGKLFNFTHVLYANQGAENSGWLDDDMVVAIAASIPGLDVPRLLADRDDATVVSQGERMDDQAQADAVQGTPTILVGKTGQALEQVALSSAADVDSVRAAIEQALR